jgi:arylsulfatase
MSERPNILWICSDQQRHDTLGCYGNPHVTTPTIDRLAGEGVLFEHCYAQSPVCTPSRISFLTGRYPVTTRLRQNGQNCPAGEVLVTKLLDEAGYVCGLSGKLHLSACDNRLLLGDEWWKADPRTYFRGIEPRIDDGYTEFHWDHGPGHRYPSSGYTRWLHERGLVFQTTPRDDCRYVKHGMPSEHHQTTWCVEKAIHFLEAYADAPHPWAFSVNMFDPHHDFDPPDDYLAPYLAHLDDVPLPNYLEGELQGKPAFQQINHRGAYANKRGDFDCQTMGEREHRLVRAAYWAMCDHIDVQVGRLIEALERTGQRENTLVIYASDHGEMLGDHGIYLKGPFFYDCAIRVPLIVSWPGAIEGGRRSKALVELADLAPTLLDVAGLERYPGMQTRSLWPLLAGRADLDRFRDDVYCEYYNAMPSHKDPKAFATMVRTEQYKLVLCHGVNEGELYDLASDATETHNLWDDAAYAEIKTEMLIRLCDRMAQTADPLPPRIGIF